MDILTFIRDVVVNWVAHTNNFVAGFIVKIGLWLVSSVVLLRFVLFRRMSQIVQILLFSIITLAFLYLPLSVEVVKHYKPFFALILLASIVIIIFLPPRLAFLLSPIRGSQITITRIIYVIIVSLFIAQLIVARR